MWCNVGVAEIIEFRKCYFAKTSTYVVSAQTTMGTKNKSWNDYSKKHKLQNHLFTINFDSKTITRTVIKTDAGVKIPDRYIDDFDMSQFPRVNQTVFEITTFTSDLITAKTAEESIIDDDTFSVSTIYFDIEGTSADIEQTYYSKITGKKQSVSNYKIKCEETLDTIADSNKLGSSGTAFFINNRGNLITNNHVVEGCELSKINYFDKEYDTNLISTDKTLDLALLKVDLKPKDFISFSNKEPRKRQTIIVAGYPLGEYLSDDLKINEGKISSLKGFENNSNEITVDLAINPGNSGGPIVDENGQLVAVAVAGMSKEVTEGISFGIKSSAVTNFLKTNKISPDIKLTSFSMNDEKVNQLLEESTVYIFCE
jgi:S1-C subfamily serine protease